MDTFFKDLRYGVRMLLKWPALTVIAVVTLGLAIGANAALFSVIDAVLLRPLPFRSPGGLVRVRTVDVASGRVDGSVSYPNFLDWRAQNKSFESMSVWHLSNLTYTGGQQPESLTAVIASANLFSSLGVTPVLGRAFTPEEDTPGDKGIPVIISQGLWESHFGSDPQVLGRAITLDGRTFNIAGVAPKSFQYPIQNRRVVQLWTTIAADFAGRTPMPAQRGVAYLDVTARLKPGVAIAQAQAELQVIQQALNKQYPDDRSRSINIISEKNVVVGNVRDALLILFGAVGFVLLIGCANVASLLLARGAARHKEIGIRMALGAGRTAILRQLLTESVLLSLCGAALGLVFASWAMDSLVNLAPGGLARVGEIHLDLRVLGFTMLVAVVTGILFGLAPALQVSTAGVSESLGEGGRSATEGAHRSRVRGILVVSEVALAFVLLMGSGLLIESVSRLKHVNPGFQPDHVVTFILDLPSNRYPHAKRPAFFKEVLQRIRELPGVRSASAVFGLPLSSQGINASFNIEGKPVAQSQRPTADYRIVTSDFFATMSIPVLEGRAFTQKDDEPGVAVAIVNETLARRFFPGENPIGKRIKPDVAIGSDETPFREIIGVVGDVKASGLTSAALADIYVPHSHGPIGLMTMIVRSSVPMENLVPSLRSAVWSIDKDLPLRDVKMLDQYVDAEVATPRFHAMLLGIFAGLAFVLTAVGLYGVVSYTVEQRTREVGIRMALGAQRVSILRMVVKQGVLLAFAGIAAGLAASFAVIPVMRSMLFGVEATDPITFVVVAVMLMTVSLLASYIPARRATKVDPMVALRYE